MPHDGLIQLAGMMMLKKVALDVTVAGSNVIVQWMQSASVDASLKNISTALVAIYTAIRIIAEIKNFKMPKK